MKKCIKDLYGEQVSVIPIDRFRAGMKIEIAVCDVRDYQCGIIVDIYASSFLINWVCSGSEHENSQRFLSGARLVREFTPDKYKGMSLG